MSDVEGFLTYGPYIELEPGSYRLTLSFDDDVQLPRFILDIPADSGKRILASLDREGRSGSGTPTTFELEFDLFDTVSAVEFRTQVFGPLGGEIRRFTMERIGPPKIPPIDNASPSAS